MYEQNGNINKDRKPRKKPKVNSGVENTVIEMKKFTRRIQWQI